MADPSTLGPNLGMPLDIPLHASGWDEPYNNAMLLLDTLLAGAVLDTTISAPPGSPSDGDSYIIAASPSGAWAGKPKYLTVFHDSAWNFFHAKKGMRLLNLNDSNFYYYDDSGAWVVEAITGPAGPTPFTPESVWTTGTVYSNTPPADYVSHLGNSYVCLVAHTAGTFATDLGASKWGLVAAKGDVGPGSLLPVAAWVTSTAYVVGPPASYVSQGGSSYECLTAHTSGTFAADLGAGKWGLVAQKGTDGTGAAGATGPAPFGALTAWVTATAYTATAPASYVSIGGSSYVCLTAHTSGTFATDLAAGKWGVVASAGLAYDLSLYVQGTPTATLHAYNLTFVRGVTMPANLAGSGGHCTTNPTGTAAFDIKKNGTTCATASISTSGVFTFTTTGGTSVSFAAGDRLDIYAPGTADATLADIGVTLAMTRP